jgi:hypothetical protein
MVAAWTEAALKAAESWEAASKEAELWVEA